MTPEQVSALSDEELNRAMIWLYYFGFDISYNNHANQYVDCTRVIDYLTDYNLTMPLVIEKSVSLNILGTVAKPVIALCGGYATHDTNLLRAACECLVLIALDKKKV